jgi:hypothetical protein
MMQELIEQGQRELVDLVSAWRKAGITGRTELQTAAFPDGLVWSHESGFLNSKNVGLMHAWHEFFQSLGDSRTMLNDFFALFGVPGRRCLNSAIQLRSFLLHWADSHSCSGGSVSVK